MGASPVIVGDLRRARLRPEPRLVSHGASTSAPAREQWKVDAARGQERPLDADPVARRRTASDQILLPGSFLLTSYDAATGKKLWWVGGLSFEMKSTPVIGGDTIYVNGYGAPVNDPGNKVNVPPADEVWKTADADGNGMLSKAEFPKFTQAFWFDVADLDTNGVADAGRVGLLPRRARFGERHARHPPRRLRRHDATRRSAGSTSASVPQLPSPLLYRRRALHGQRQRHRHDAQSRHRRA